MEYTPIPNNFKPEAWASHVAARKDGSKVESCLWFSDEQEYLDGPNPKKGEWVSAMKKEYWDFFPINRERTKISAAVDWATKEGDNSSLETFSFNNCGTYSSEGQPIEIKKEVLELVIYGMNKFIKERYTAEIERARDFCEKLKLGD